MALLDKLFGPPGKDKFARMVIAALVEAGETEPIRYDPAEFRIQTEGDGKRIFQLGNVYDEYVAAHRSQRHAVLRRLVRSWFSYFKEVPEALSDIGTDLLPTVRARGYFETTRLQCQIEGGPPLDWPYEIVAEHLGIGLVYDLPESMVQINRSHLTRWGVQFEDALSSAEQNLEEMSREPFDHPFPGFWVSPWRDNHDAARLILTERIGALPVKGDPVAMVPNRDLLLITGSLDAAGLGHLATLAEEAYGQPRFLSGLAVRLEGETWQPFLPSPNSSAYHAFKDLAVKSLGRDYATQGELLESLYEKEDRDLYVAAYSAVRKKETNEVFSYCVWTEGVDAILPRTHKVFFFRPNGEGGGDIVARGDWEHIREVVGHLMTPLDLYPERYRVRQFPSAGELIEIRG